MIKTLDTIENDKQKIINIVTSKDFLFANKIDWIFDKILIGSQLGFWFYVMLSILNIYQNILGLAAVLIIGINLRSIMIRNHIRYASKIKDWGEEAGE